MCVCVIVYKCERTNGGVALHDTMQMTSLYGLIFEIISHMCSIFVGITRFVKLCLSEQKFAFNMHESQNCYFF